MWIIFVAVALILDLDEEYLFNGPEHPIGIVNKVIFLVVIFRNVTGKKLDWCSLPSVQENKRDTRESFELFMVTSLCVCACACACVRETERERK